MYSERDLPPIIYISGPMTGHVDFNYPSFFKAEERLRAIGCSVVNPAAYGGAVQTGLSYEGLLKRDIRLLLDCTGVASLPDWEQSKGARLEHHVAKVCRIEIHTVDEWFNKLVSVEANRYRTD